MRPSMIAILKKKKMKLGDLVYYFTKYGIRYIWKKIYPNCGCDQRREEWNKITFTSK